jgi:hypothetical protein
MLRLYKRLDLLVILTLSILSVLLTACGGGATASEPLAAAWVGKVEGTEAFIAIASNGTELMAYVCDSQTITQWFHAKTGVDQLDLVAGTVDVSSEGAKLQAQLTQTTATGTVTLADGQAHKFTAAKAEGDAGLYRLEETANNEQLLTGWVVLNDGQLRGMQVNLNTAALQPQTTLNNLAKIIGPTIPQY